jgi:hypothetical protein
MQWFKGSLLVCIVLVCSCGIFTPRSVESPVTIIIKDPFNFASLTWGANRKFAKLSFADLFDDSLMYYDLSGNEFSRSDFETHLNTTVLGQITIEKTTWTLDSTLSDIVYTDEHYLLRRIYRIEALDPDQTGIVFSGQVWLDVEYDNVKNTWTIKKWYDKYLGYSIFNPYYKP